MARQNFIAALECADRGWRVVPNYTPTLNPERPCSCGKPDCKHPGKHPRLMEWPQFASKNRSEVKNWFSKWPNANVGIATGAGTGWFVLDVDGEEGAETLRLMEKANGSLPRTVEQITGGGGRHMLFQYEPGLKNEVRFAPGLDIRTDGGQILVEPSLHASGRHYAWDVDHYPGDVEIAKAPGWLLKAIREAVKQQAETQGTDGKVGEGKRNDLLFRDGCALRQRGLSERAIGAALWVVNEERCDPPLSKDEVEKIAASAARYVPGTPSSNGRGPEEIGELKPGRGASQEQEPAARWEEPLPLYSVVLPSFPVRALPCWLADMVEAVAEATQTPPDLAGMIGLSVLATAAQKRLEALVRPGWREPLSLWTVTALPPGNRKSPAFAPMIAPIVEYERELVGQMAREIAVRQTEYEIAEGALKRLKDQAIKAKTEFERDSLTREATNLAESLQDLRVPVSPRLMADDATPERLGMLLDAHGGRMSVLAAEGDVFDMMAGKYSSTGANIGLYLRGHSGDDLIVDRVNRPAIVVRRAAISFGLTVQPELLLGLTSNAAFRGRGLLGRLLYSVPKSTLGGRTIRADAIPTATAMTYHARIKQCLAVPANKSEDGEPCPHFLEFSAGADDEVARFETWIEPQLKAGRALGYIADWAGKLAGQMVRIAALLHLAQMAETGRPWTFAVDPEEVVAARIIAEYLIPHAQAAFQAMGTDPALNGARQVIEWIKEQQRDSFTKRDAHRAMQSVFGKAGDLDAPLLLLCDHGYLRQRSEPKRSGPGQSPSPTFEVHPSLIEG